jgi:hypothetical protein
MGISNDIGARIDMLYELREQRLGIEKRVKELKEQEVQARNDIFELLASMGLTKASGALATCGIKVTNVPLVEDWDTLWGYIQQTGEFDLVQKRISVTAWRARFDDGVTIPGVSKVEDVDISLTKASRSI